MSNLEPRPLKGPTLLHLLVHEAGLNGSNALEFQDQHGQVQSLSYSELHRRSDAFARGIGRILGGASNRESRNRLIIPILLPQSVSLYVTILGVLKAGGAFCPLNLDAPLERVKFVAEDVAANLIVTSRSLKPNATWSGGPQLVIVEDMDLGGPSHHHHIMRDSTSPNDPAYVMYTSGSTGVPKGVVVSHAAATQSLLAHDEHIPPFKRFLQFAAPTFDVSIFEIFFPFFRGATLVGRSRNELLSNLNSTINNMHIDAAELTPTVVGSLLGNRKDVPGLKLLLTIGEMLTKSIIEEFGGDQEKESILFGMYGPTEAAIHCTLAPKLASNSSPGNIGIPLSTVSALVIKPISDDAQPDSPIEILPDESVGELAVGGHQLADGYLNREKQTSQSFVDTESFGRIYRTGDKAVRHADGSFECLGRLNSSQIKLRGQRVELGEIEAVAISENQISFAVVRLIDSILVLFCRKDDTNVSTQQIQENCSKRLPKFMIPQETVFLEDVPRLPSGKIDKSQLDAMYREKRDRELANEDGTASHVETTIQQLVKLITGQTPALDASLTAVGMDSLRAIKLGSELRKQGHRIDVADILKADCVAGIADILSETDSEDSKSSHTQTAISCPHSISKSEKAKIIAAAEDVIEIEDIWTCSTVQVGMIAETFKDAKAYQNSVSLEVSDRYSAEQIISAFQTVASLNSILRCVFVQPHGESASFFTQVVLSKLPSRVFYANGQDEERSTFENDGILWPLQIYILRQSGKTVIEISIHHAIYDGWAQDLLLADLDAALLQKPLPERPQFSGVLKYMQSVKDSDLASQSDQYWSLLLQNAVPCNMPLLYKESERGLASGHTDLRVVIDKTQLAGLGQKLHVSPQTLFQAAFAYLLSLYCGESNFTFGTVSSGRTSPVDGIEDIIGPCIVTLPIKTEITALRTANDLMVHIHKQNRMILRHQHSSLQQITKDSNLPQGERLFDALFIWQENLHPQQKLESLRHVDSTDFLEYSLTFEAEPFDDFVCLKANYNENLWPREHAVVFLKQIEMLAQSILRDPWLALEKLTGSFDENLLSYASEMPKVVDEELKVNAGAEVALTHLSFPDRLVPRGAVGELRYADSRRTSSQQGLQSIPHMKRTGLLGRLLFQNEVVNLGPLSHVSRVAGMKIDTGAITNILLRHEEVTAAFTCVVPQLRQLKRSREQIVCFWVPPNQPAPHFYVIPHENVAVNTVDSLFNLLEESLPAHLVPILLAPVSRFPTAKDGRTNPKELIEGSRHFSQGWVEYFSRIPKPTSKSLNLSATELSIAKALLKVTQDHSKIAEDMGRRTSFFAMGIDSIQAIRFSRELKDAKVGRADVATILKHHTIATLAKAIKPLENNEASKSSQLKATSVFKDAEKLRINDMFEATGKTVENILPCTPLQEAMISSSLAGHRSDYYNHIVLRLFCDLAKLKEIWRSLVSAHSILRTAFVTSEDATYPIAQVVLAQHALPWQELKIEASGYQEILRQVTDQAVSSLCEDTPPWSISLLRGPKKTHMVLSLHHALYDAAALNQLMTEVYLRFNDQWIPRSVPFSTFLDFMVSQVPEEADQFWQAQLKGFSPATLPALHPSFKSIDEPNGISTHSFEWKLSEVEEKVQATSTSLLSLCQTSWVSVLASILGVSDVCFGSILNGRTLPIEDVDRLIAPCFNTVPCRVKFSSSQSNSDLLRTLQHINSEILPFQLTSLRHLQAKHKGGRSRLFDTLVLLQEGQYDSGWGLWSVESDIGQIDFPIVLEIIPQKGRDKLDVKLHFYRSLLDDASATIILETFEAIACNILTYPESHTADLAFLQTDLRRRLRELAGLMKEATVPVDKGAPQTDSDQNDKGSFTQSQSVIRSVYAQLSRVPVDQINLDTSIFRLGLDSINAVQAASILRKKHITVSSNEILNFPSIRQLTKALEDQQPSNFSQVDLIDFERFQLDNIGYILQRYGLSAETVEAIRPCTAIQTGIISQFLQSDQHTYYNSFDMLFHGDKHELSKLKNAWKEAGIKHQMLRTGFSSTNNLDNPFVMVIFKHDVIEQPWKDVEVFSSVEDLSARVIKHLEQPPWCVECRQLDAKEFSLRFSALHAIYDARSLAKIFDDIAKVYRNAQPAAAKSIDETLSIILASNTTSSPEVSSFWKDVGTGISNAKFPSLAPFNSVKSDYFAHSIKLRNPIDVLEAKCKELEISLQAAFQTAWARLLSEITGETSTTFGTVSSGIIDSNATNDVSFPSIVTLPTILELKGTFNDVFRTAIAHNSRVRRFQFTPLSQIQKHVGLTGQRLFDTILVYQGSTEGSESHPWEITHESASADYPISIELGRSKNETTLRLTARSDLIPEGQANLMLAQLEEILNHILAHPQSDVVDPLPLSTMLLSVVPAKEDEIKSDMTFLHSFVEQQSDRIPDKTALEFSTGLHTSKHIRQTWTYRELSEEGDRVAALLAQADVRHKDLIGVCFDKCPEASFAMLGILKAGCAFLAIDPAAPFDRKKFIFADSKSRFVLTTAHLADELEDLENLTVFALDKQKADSKVLRKSERKLPLAKSLSPSDPCYCLYTSGTTGTPKGCLVSHENAVQALLSFQRLFSGHWDQDSKFLQFASFHFDVSVLEQYWSWSVGICMSSAPRDEILEDIAGTIQKLRITHIDLTPSLARTIDPEDVPSLHDGVFITGGEKLLPEICQTWGEIGCIYNGYGPTEATIGVTMLQRVPKNAKPSNIGRQFDNVGAYVLRPNGTTPVLKGGIGELCVSGKLIGLGYLNRPKLTAEKFPTLESGGVRIYRTGDFVRLLHDGSFEFLGRSDDQVKLRGQRLETSEINEVIKNGVAEIEDAITLVIKHPSQHREQLVAFILLSGDRDIKIKAQLCVGAARGKTVTAAQDACHAKLPGYMVPTHFVPITSIPLNINNKANAKELKSLYEQLSTEDIQQLSRAGYGSQEKWSSDESRLIDAVEQYTKVPASQVKPWSTIFSLGLDSISVVGFARFLKEQGHQNVTITKILQNPTIKSLSSVLGQRNDAQELGLDSTVLAAQQSINAFAHRSRATVYSILDLRKDQIETIAPCTPLQEGIVTQSLKHSTPLYFNTFRLVLAPSVDIKLLEIAWRLAFRKVQSLRICFVPTDEGVAQVVVKNPELTWNEQSLQDETHIDETLKSINLRWWNLNRETIKSPFQLHILRCSGRVYLCINIFHGNYDGISLPLLLHFVSSAYNDNHAKDMGLNFTDALPFGPLRGVSDEGQKYWKKALENHPGNRLPKLEEINPVQSEKVTKSSLEFMPWSLEHLQRGNHTTTQTICQTVWNVVLQKHVRQATALGVVVSGRTIEYDDANQIIGPMFNTIPFFADMSRMGTWTQAIQQVHKYNTASLPYQHTALRQISKWCDRSSDEPLFETLFVFQIGTEKLDEDKDALWTVSEPSASAGYPISFEAVLLESNLGTRLKLTIVAQSSYVGSEMADEMLEDFKLAYNQLMQAPKSRPLDGPSMPAKPLSNDPVPVVETVGGSGPKWSSEYHPRETKESESSSWSEVENVNFVWSTEATSIRQTIVSLAGVDEDEVTPDISIFQLGLDSIDVIKIVSRLKKEGMLISASAIMQNPTISKMVTKLRKQTLEQNSIMQNSPFDKLAAELNKYAFTNIEETARDQIEDVLPATSLQEAIVAEMIASGFTRYFNHEVLRLGPNVDLKRLESAFEKVYRSTPILRTTFIAVDEPSLFATFAQIIYKPASLPWTELSMDKNQPFTTIFSQITSEIEAKISTTSLFRLTFVAREAERFLILSLSHGLYDGWSIGLLHEDISKAYQGLEIARPSFNSTLKHIWSSAADGASDFWRTQFSDAIACSWPTCESSNTDEVHRLEQNSKADLDDIKAFCRTMDITLQSLGQACWSLILAHYTQQLDVVFGAVLSGRESEESREIIFPTMNTVAIRSIIHGSRREMVKYLQSIGSEMIQFQHYPLRNIQSIIPDRSTGLFDTLFIVQQKRGKSSDSYSPYTPVEGDSNVEYPICVEIEVNEENLIWRCACKDSKLSSEASILLLRQLDGVLRAIMKSPNEPAVAYLDGKVMICGLPTISLRSNATSSSKKPQNVNNTTPVSFSHGSGSTETLRSVCEVISRVSGVVESDINVDQTLYHVGLDSISAIKVSSLLRKQGIMISVGTMLKAASVQNIAAAADANRTVTSESASTIDVSVAKSSLSSLSRAAILSLAGIPESAVQSILPVTSGQMYMLSHWYKSKGALFHSIFEYQFKGAGLLSKSKLQRAWQKLCEQNEALRIVFTTTGSTEIPFVQVVLLSQQAEILWNSPHSGLPSAQNVPQAELVIPDTKSDILSLRIHHALYDGVSLSLLIKQLEGLYREEEIPALQGLWNEFAVEEFSRSKRDQVQSFWQTYLSELIPITIPQTPGQPTGRNQLFRSAVSKSDRIVSFARSNGISTQALFLAVTAHVLATLSSKLRQDSQSVVSRSRDMVLAVYLANRSPLSTGHDITFLAAPTLNVIPLRLLVADGPDSIIKSARKAQEDLRRFPEEGASASALWEIQKHVPDLKVGGTVNFLSLPNDERNAPAGPLFEEVRPDWESQPASVDLDSGVSGRDLGLPDTWHQWDGWDAYESTIDLEATIKGGALDIGVFYPKTLQGCDQASWIIEEIARVLEKVCSS